MAKSSVKDRNEPTFSKGLEGVIADETAVSNVEGDIGRLSYRGYDIESLVRQDYETVMWLVLFGELPTPSERNRLAGFLADQGPLAPEELALLKALPRDLHPMQMLQAMIVLLSKRPVAFEGLDHEGAFGLGIIAKLPTLVANFYHLGKGSALPAFDPSAPHLRNFLTMFTGKTPSDEHVDILKVVQILQMEHSFNAGTFTSRVVASTLAPVDSVFSAAVGALFGILHGGADEAALNDAKKVGSPQAAAAFVDDLLANKGKLMGMGHREYRRLDPRAAILKPMAQALCKGTEFQNAYDTLEALELAFNRRMQEKGNEMWANIEFYKGAVFEAIGIPSRYFTAMFAMARSVGWLAHFIESRRENRIVRPKAAYVGAPHRSV